MKITIELHDLSEWAALAVVAQRVSGVITMPEQSAKIETVAIQVPVPEDKKPRGNGKKSKDVAAPAPTAAPAPAPEPTPSPDWPAQLGGEPVAAPGPEPTPEPVADVAALGQHVREVLTKLAKAGKTMAVKSLLAKHGAESMSLLDPAKYQAVLDEAALL